MLMDARVKQMEVESGNVYQEEFDYPISASEVSEQLKLLKNWKAGGPDGLRNELLKICHKCRRCANACGVTQQDMGG